MRDSYSFVCPEDVHVQHYKLLELNRSAMPPAFSTSRVAIYKLEFSDSSGISWSSIARTMNYIDILLARHLVGVVANFSESSNDIDVIDISSVTSGIQGA